MLFMEEITLLNAKAATGIDKVLDVNGFDSVLLAVGTASSANFTLKFAAATSATAPDPTSSVSVANMFAYAGYVDVTSGSFTAGGTGITSAGTDVFQIVRIDTRGMRWLIPHVTARSAGSVTVKALAYVLTDT